MSKSRDAFRTISEVADWLETPAHVLRFWESKFSQVKPVKRAGGRRYYRPADMELLGGIKKLLHEEGMTIKGVQKVLREQGVRHVSGLSAMVVDDEDEDGALVEDAPFEEVGEEAHVSEILPFPGAAGSASRGDPRRDETAEAAEVSIPAVEDPEPVPSKPAPADTAADDRAPTDPATGDPVPEAELGETSPDPEAVEQAQEPDAEYGERVPSGPDEDAGPPLPLGPLPGEDSPDAASDAAPLVSEDEDQGGSGWTVAPQDDPTPGTAGPVPGASDQRMTPPSQLSAEAAGRSDTPPEEAGGVEQGLAPAEPSDDNAILSEDSAPQDRSMEPALGANEAAWENVAKDADSPTGYDSPDEMAAGPAFADMPAPAPEASDMTHASPIEANGSEPQDPENPGVSAEEDSAIEPAPVPEAKDHVAAEPTPMSPPEHGNETEPQTEGDGDSEPALSTDGEDTRPAPGIGRPVDLPDFTAQAEATQVPGPLSHLARLTTLNTPQAQRMAAPLAALKALSQRLNDPRP